MQRGGDSGRRRRTCAENFWNSCAGTVLNLFAQPTSNLWCTYTPLAAQTVSLTVRTIVFPLTAPKSINPPRKDVARRILPEIDISPLGERWPLGTGFAPHPLPLRGVSIPRVAKNLPAISSPATQHFSHHKSIPPITT